MGEVVEVGEVEWVGYVDKWVRGVCVGTWVRGYACMRVHGYADAWVRRYVATWVRGYVGTWVRGYVGGWRAGLMGKMMYGWMDRGRSTNKHVNPHGSRRMSGVWSLHGHCKI